MILIKLTLFFSVFFVLIGCGSFMEGKTTPYVVKSGAKALVLKQPDKLSFSLDQEHVNQCSLIEEHVNAFHREYLPRTTLESFSCHHLSDINETHEGLKTQGRIVRSKFTVVRLDKNIEFALDRTCQEKKDPMDHGYQKSCVAKVKRLVAGEVGSEWKPIPGEEIIALNVQHLAATLESWLSKSDDFNTAWSCEQKGRLFSVSPDVCVMNKPVALDLQGEITLHALMENAHTEDDIKAVVKSLTSSYYNQILSSTGVVLDDSKSVIVKVEEKQNEQVVDEKNKAVIEIKSFSYEHTFSLPSKNRSLTLISHYYFAYIDKKFSQSVVLISKKEEKPWNPENKDEDILVPELNNYVATLKKYADFSLQDPKKDPSVDTHGDALKSKNLFLGLLSASVSLNDVKEKSLTGLNFHQEIQNSCQKYSDLAGCIKENSKIFMRSSKHSSFKDFDFSKSIFSEIPLDGVKFEGAVFKNSEFRGLNSFEKMDLRSVSFNNATLENVKFENVMFDKDKSLKGAKTISGCCCVDCDGVDENIIPNCN